MSPLQRDNLPGNLIPNAAQSPRIVAFIGYLGDSHTDGSVRLYLDEEMREWFDVAETDILHSEPNSTGPIDRTVIWVDQRTTLGRRQPQPEDLQGEYLDGELAAVTVPQTAMSVALDWTSIVRTWAKWRYE
jgi:hypothetical protein